jgi:hypothetical protein
MAREHAKATQGPLPPVERDGRGRPGLAGIDAFGSALRRALHPAARRISGRVLARRGRVAFESSPRRPSQPECAPATPKAADAAAVSL